MKMAAGERVVVAMSGGVDSAVAAALLQQQGYQVIGMMLRLWSESGKEDDNRCCTPDAQAQARRVAAILDIPFYVLDARQVFREIVVNYFLDGYAQGATPNPCLACNRHVRWEFLLERALALGARFMATGHYARLAPDASGSIQVLRAVDQAKDQSYVLHVLTQKQLACAKFPVGEFSKTEIRQLAGRFALPVAHRPDSQDLCFLGKDDYRQFLLRNAPGSILPGPILKPSGEKIGEHQGLSFYTIGQRKGLGLASPVPLYVIEKDFQNNALIVAHGSELGKNELIAGEVNWICGTAPPAPFRAQLKIRYKASAAWAEVTPLEKDRVYIKFDESLRDITPGQAAVIYSGEVCLGGGIILASEGMG